MTTIIKPIGKVGKGGAKMVKAGTKGVFKAAKKGAVSVTSLHSSPPSPRRRRGHTEPEGFKNATVRPRPGRMLRTDKMGEEEEEEEEEMEETEESADAWKKKLKKELISPEEEKLLEELLLKEDVFAGDTATEELMSNLAKQVQALDAANIYALLSSGGAIQDLVQGIDDVDRQLDELHTWLSYYANQLTNIQNYIKNIEEKNNEMEILARNQHSLLEELDTILTTFSLDENTTSLLTFGELEVGSKLEAATAAAERWETHYKAAALLRDSSSDIANMASVQRQMAEFERFRDIFAARLERFLSELLFSLRGALLDEKAQLRDHKIFFRKLEPYRDLMHWLQRNKFATYLHLTQTYAECMQHLYDEEQKSFFTEIKRAIPKEPRDSLKFIGTSAAAGQPNRRESISLKKESKAYQILPQGLRDWIMVTVSEHIFSEEMFAFPPSRDIPLVPSLINLEALGDGLNEDLPKLRGVRAMGGGISLASLLAQAFGMGISAWKAVLASVVKYDYLLATSLIIEIEAQLVRHEKDCEALVSLLTKELLIPAVRMFQKAIEEEMTSLAQLQPSAKAAGILPSVIKYPQFVDEMEPYIDSGSTLGGQLVRWAVVKILSSLTQWLDSLGEEDDSKHCYILRAENYHYLYSALSSKQHKKRIEFLNDHLDQALAKVNSNLMEFIHGILYSKQNFYALKIFFEGIENLLRTLPSEEIQFQSSHSSEVFSRIATTLARPRTEKRLGAIMKHIKCYFCKESGLMPVAFTRLQEVFLAEYAHYEELTAQCYKHLKLPLTSSKLQELLLTARRQYDQ